ncbi:MAG: sulfatase-like hydrolase/transferase [Holophagales bacterium]|nr:sulfatase-like hydrolase/transferase [Holophagales bacterium]MYD24028.1 sulfatase-like hydrolase/transferase [Holophagales bacterium]MYI32951.1 sulfatase-like hydrolase/transferase [Holophagales bacterium]
MSRTAAIALACGGALLACAAPPALEEERVTEAARPNVVLISIDTLRSDRLPAYGYDGVETPAIDRLAAGGVLFERAWTHVNVTLPSHVSLFTGLLPSEHGVRDNAGYRLDEGIPTLVETLRGEGYATGGFVSSYVLRVGTGMERGFDVYDDGVRFETGRDFGELQRPGPETLDAAARWLGDVEDAPFFLFLHLYEPHAPYNPPPPFADRYADPYDGEVAAADAVVGDLIRRLEERGLYDDALVILLSDHGEGLMDHGEMDHLILIYREVLQVPLIVKLPDAERAGERVSANAQLGDVAPTVHSLLGLGQPEGFVGTDLLALGAEPASGAVPRQIVSESVYPRIHFGWSDLGSIVEGDLHFIESPAPELFRLSEDPGERNNVILEERAAARRMRAAIEAIDRSLASPVEDDPEIRRRLESLGYLSGGARAGDGPLPDPKSRIGAVEELARAARLAADGELEAAESALRSVLRTEPQLIQAWHELGEILERRGRPAAALDAYRQAFEASGGDAAASGVKVAELLLRAGRVAEAREHALAVTDRSPLAPQVLAEAALIEGDLESAAEHLERALAERGPRITPLIVRTSLLNAQGRFEEALAQSDEALAEFGDRRDRSVLARLHLHRGTALGALARAEEAERSYREAIALDRGLLGAYSSLAFLFAVEERAAEAGRTLQEMVTVNPAPEAYAEAVRTLRAMRDERSAEAVLAEALRRWPDSEALRRGRLSP